MARSKAKLVTIRFSATLQRPRPAVNGKIKAVSAPVTWTFLTLPTQASAKLPSRSMVSVEGTINGASFQATLQPDGNGGHWLKVDCELRQASGAAAGDSVTLEISPLPPDQEPEPKVPADLKSALAAASPTTKDVW